MATAAAASCRGESPFITPSGSKIETCVANLGGGGSKASKARGGRAGTHVVRFAHSSNRGVVGCANRIHPLDQDCSVCVCVCVCVSVCECLIMCVCVCVCV